MKRRKQVWIQVACIAAVIALGGTFAEARAQVTQVRGKVTLKQADGTEVPLTRGMTVASGSTVTTGAKSSAVVSLGKLGRVEVMPESAMKLSDDDSGFTAMLDQGRVRISSSTGVNATTTTGDGSIVADRSGDAEFEVDITCGNTLVRVKKGTVELRAGNSVKQIAAGNQDTAGQAKPGCTPSARPK